MNSCAFVLTDCLTVGYDSYKHVAAVRVFLLSVRAGDRRVILFHFAFIGTNSIVQTKICVVLILLFSISYKRAASEINETIVYTNETHQLYPAPSLTLSSLSLKGRFDDDELKEVLEDIQTHMNYQY